jgi:multiple sugar transport system ATP-binding protein
MAEIVFDHVTKCYPDGTEAVTDLQLEIDDGEFMILVGPSGCGKSTALRMVAGLEEISDGVLRIGENVVNECAPKERDIAMVFQSYALYPQMTVRQNMGFALKLAKMRKAEIRDRVERAAKILDLEDQLERKPGSLSGGQRQRVAMGRAIVREPEAFLMDEPLSNLDAKLRVQMRASIAHLQRQLGTTMIYVTHDQVEAMTLGDRVAVMRNGVLQQVGPPKQLYEAPDNVFVAGFIGSPPMNLVTARLERDRLVLPFGEAEIPERLRQAAERNGSGREVIAGIRPEAFEELGSLDQAAGRGGIAIEVKVVLVEELGADVLVHLDIPQSGLSAPASDDELRRAVKVVARLGGSSRATLERPLPLHLETDAIELFDAASHRNLKR